ncbi:hypothetical protein HCN44_001776 [Aphidius gifuensis]|uniref:SDE2-like domain-containing protein n=1 Tax=Aphidius gifuensis TaxID=684658 RepID=A0A834XUJ1_APHGI|nr:replication stress response regulator SDE2 [Aphidius gifuensis]KAF7992451.1 hypothetical protein HCN44_001776 [Aphidius gifuensis]
MLQVKLESGHGCKTIFTDPKGITLLEMWIHLENLGFSKEQFYALKNGRTVEDDEQLLQGSLTILPKLVGGKGGFGSMLRAIGAQIEKTTNREACRDLSGRRLRDINEEKRLKAWMEKKDTRKEEAVERKKKKLERLCAEPRHEFKDKNYEHERSVLTDKIDDAVEKGFKMAKIIEETKQVAGASNAKKGVKRKTFLDDFDEDIDSDDLTSSDDDDDDKKNKLNKKPKTINNDKTDNSAGTSTESSSSDPENENIKMLTN